MYIHHVNNRNNALLTILCYGVLLFAHGYVYGFEDQMDFMPYALHLQEKSWFSGDFYINCIQGQVNERWFIAHALSWVPVSVWPVLFFAVHFIAGTLLIQGLLKFCNHAALAFWAQWAVIVSCLILLYHRNLGGNELYYNMVTPSLLAKCAGIWALWFAIKQAKWRAAGCTILATYLQPVAGVQVFLLCAILIGNQARIVFILTSLCLILPYLLPLFFQLGEGTQEISLVSIMQLRNPHHFMPSHFGWFNIWLLTPLYAMSTTLAFKLDRKLFYLMVFIISGCLIYMLMLNIMPELSYKTQWFKTTIWLKFFSILIMARWLTQEHQSVLDKLSHRFRLFLVYIFFASVLVMAFRQSRYASYSFPGSALSIAQQAAVEASSISQPGDVFLVPADFTAFKFYSRRPTWVDWKAIPHQSRCLSDWAEKIKLAYGLETGYQGNLNAVYAQSNRFLSTLSPDAKKNLKDLGVVYILFRPENSPGYRTEKL